MIRRKSCGPSYALCSQTVTAYHADVGAAFACTKTVFHNAFLDYKKVVSTEKTGSSEANSFLLIIPGAGIPVQPGDKVLLGEGADVTTREQWAALTPVSTPGLVVVRYVDPKYYNGVQCHTEAGG